MTLCDLNLLLVDGHSHLQNFFLTDLRQLVDLSEHFWAFHHDSVWFDRSSELRIWIVEVLGHVFVDFGAIDCVFHFAFEQHWVVWWDYVNDLVCRLLFLSVNSDRSFPASCSQTLSKLFCLNGLLNEWRSVNLIGCQFLLLSRVAIMAVVLVHQFLELTARRWPLRGKVMLLLSILRRGSSRHLKDAIILLGQAVV